MHSSALALHGTPLEVAAAGGLFHAHGLSLPEHTDVRSCQTAAGSGPYRGLVRESSCYTRRAPSNTGAWLSGSEDQGRGTLCRPRGVRRGFEGACTFISMCRLCRRRSHIQVRHQDCRHIDAASPAAYTATWSWAWLYAASIPRADGRRSDWISKPRCRIMRTGAVWALDIALAAPCWRSPMNA